MRKGRQGKRRKPMSAQDRAAQFAPFSALDGYAHRLYEAIRTTEPFHVLTEEEAESLNQDLARLADLLEGRSLAQIRLLYFFPDPKKAGGSYQEVPVKVRRVDFPQGFLLSTDRKTYAFARIREIRWPKEGDRPDQDPDLG